MDEQSPQNDGSKESADQFDREIPFDATTNFSILGWLWAKLNRAKSSKEHIDLTLEP